MIQQLADEETNGDSAEMVRVLVSEAFSARHGQDVETIKTEWYKVEDDITDEERGRLFRELVNEAILARRASSN